MKSDLIFYLFLFLILISQMTHVTSKIDAYKIFLIILMIAPAAMYAQSHRFIYSYSFAPDSAKTDSMITEYTRLDVFQDHSEFLSDVGAKKDSTISSAVRNRQSQADIKLPDGKYANKTFKSKELIYTIEYIGIQPFKVIRDQKLNWKLLGEKKKIQGYDCQKALLHYGGRKWEAWFTADIPFQDGPYVFNGLPGLIVQIRDAENQHSFLLVENFKVPDVKTNLINKPYFVPVEVSEAQFNKKWNEYRKNPVGATEQFMMMNPGLLSGESFDTNGNKIDMSQKKREEKEYATRQLHHNNNFIDLILYQNK
ncbi:GLPGLI family protein [uncultured Chryseobacterium sp.]|uniref:GLPGLI family protein n=1 Tax=uncultured Chryseobacterium sp. TaxID=259322 RepID=UPI0025F3392F|nr:GLPGLI family protein [uncultured Chryseobacterium sp.]